MSEVVTIKYALMMILAIAEKCKSLDELKDEIKKLLTEK